MAFIRSGTVSWSELGWLNWTISGSESLMGRPVKDEGYKKVTRRYLCLSRTMVLNVNSRFPDYARVHMEAHFTSPR